jgi:hypothetical protein
MEWAGTPLYLHPYGSPKATMLCCITSPLPCLYDLVIFPGVNVSPRVGRVNLITPRGWRPDACSVVSANSRSERLLMKFLPACPILQSRICNLKFHGG